jgi:hypothetical protein
MSKILPNDPRAEYRRKAKAARRAGVGARCACGESRPESIVPGSDPKICEKCNRKSKGHVTTDNHHIFGEANSNATLGVPVNDHRAELSTAQYNWPPKTLENPESSPLLTGAAIIRGFGDTVLYLVEKFLIWVATMLELLDTVLERKLGKKWWKHTKLERLEPET